ncbi:hypothetical protein [Cyclobacterium plantarum]|uniref:Uncharacterized protein n=1 Tax=Cyclobacterium plantarum TaxID=2716263 RepID=A0ABX0H687_9BACT|nr:hypothetical protein [Cyclobacterium plantarum]NHE57366.1 hypothetical protein [Cyclobacterium plantarum]
MQENWVLSWEEPISEKEFKNALPLIFEQKRKELAIFLSLYTKTEGAIAENIRLLSWEASVSIIKGSLWLGFNKVFYNACLNINETDQDKMKIDYEANSPVTKIILSGPYIPEREPDDI